MHEDVKRALRAALDKGAAAVQPKAGQFKEMHLIWNKQSAGNWRGGWEERPGLTMVFMETHQALDDAASEFIGALRRYHPEHDGLVGVRGIQINLTHSPSFVLGRALLTLWERHGTFQPDDAAFEAVVQEFSDFIDRTKIRLCFTVQLLNYRMDGETLILPGDLAIRQLTEQEVTDIHGGSVWGLAFTSGHYSGLHEYAIVGEENADKLLGIPENSEPSVLDDIRERLDRVMLALRTFKEGRIGCGAVRLNSLAFCPIPLPWMAYGDLYVPSGQFAVSREEMETLRQHAALVIAWTEPAMETACSRLADSQTRLRPQDQLLDAIVGLEALLLAGLSADGRGELKFRFSLNYSTLHDTPEARYRAFLIAKDLYNLRSKIAHGGVTGSGTCQLGDEKVTVQEAARRASEVLRSVVHRFLTQPNQAPYKQHQFWERGYFGLPHAD